MKYSRQLVIGFVCIAAIAAGCDMFQSDGASDKGKAADMQGKLATATLRPSRAATTQPANNNVTGQLTFEQTSDMRVHVTGEVRGLTPNSEHGFHIHESGDLSAADLSSAGPHFNPTGAKHGGMHGEHRHLGDLGNIRSDGNGVAKVDVTAENVSLGGKNSIVGKSVLVHAKADDLKTDPAGDSGARVAGGVIEMKK